MKELVGEKMFVNERAPKPVLPTWGQTLGSQTLMARQRDALSELELDLDSTWTHWVRPLSAPPSYARRYVALTFVYAILRTKSVAANELSSYTRPSQISVGTIRVSTKAAADHPLEIKQNVILNVSENVWRKTGHCFQRYERTEE